MQRKLTAILSADVVGYSRLMELDEAGTLERLKANRVSIFDPQVANHGGRQFKLMGDGALVEFASVIAAVNCALAIQEASEKAEAKPIRYRIGINLGEVIVEGDDIYGEGVNVAARLQSLAPAGGVALSRVVRDQVEGKAACVFEDMGEHTVKNINRPVHVYSVRAAGRNEPEVHKVEAPHKLSICVLPFANMSADAEQEYFSDGISEDIITDLSKVSALFVVARNTAFQFKGKSIDIPQVARQLKVGHVLEGSVRKSGGRVRITAQLIDGTTGGHVWAERFDRDLNDIFALQDEISEAIVKALKLKLLPEEKQAIEERGTDNVEAYNLFLMARQSYVTGFENDSREVESIVRLCKRITEIDPTYARAWALMALGQMLLRFLHAGNAGNAGNVDDGLNAAERALALDATLAEAHAVKARIFSETGRQDEAATEIKIALRLDPESYEVNRSAAYLSFRDRRMEDAIRHFEKAMSLVGADFSSAGMLISCYNAVGNSQAVLRAAQITLERTEKVLTLDRNNGTAIGHGSNALAVLGQAERAKEWMNRALLVDPDNYNMRYNFACSLAAYLKDSSAALDMLEPVFAHMSTGLLMHAKVDPDFDHIRDDPRFKAMIAAAEVRLAGSS
ncbi:MAG: adenylate/guanylate cyclase domain-containing protein [Alphaproteobacteria bacterium]|nr:adenylate/guanylate cyclase domain-containing protein [Alphaproteobacteria bacterium]